MMDQNFEMSSGEIPWGMGNGWFLLTACMPDVDGGGWLGRQWPRSPATSAERGRKRSIQKRERRRARLGPGT